MTRRTVLMLLASGCLLATPWLAGVPARAAARRYGVNLSLNALDPARTPAALRETARAGASSVHVTVFWAHVQPQPGAFQWGAYDRFFEGVRTLRLDPVVQLAYATQWNTTAPPEERNRARREHYPPADLGAWERYVTAVVTRYRDVVDAWEVWNEPDLKYFWGGTPAEYARLLAVASQAIRKADPGARVLMGGLALAGRGSNTGFFRAILADADHPAAASFDVANFHHYGTAAEAKKRFDFMRGELTRAGADGRPLWVTETGYSSFRRFQEDPAYTGPEGQARWLEDTLPLLLRLGVERVFWFQTLDDRVPRGRFAMHGLFNRDGTAKPALEALRRVAR